MSRRCTVSMVGRDRLTHTIDVEANSLFEAAYEGVKAWSKFWYWGADDVLEVRSGVQVWRVTGSRASEWYVKQLRQRD